MSAARMTTPGPSLLPAPAGAKKDEKIEGEDEFKDVYKDLVKIVEKESRNVRV